MRLLLLTFFVFCAIVGSSQVNVGMADGTALNGGQAALLIQLKPLETFNTPTTNQWANGLVTIEYDGAFPEPATAVGAVSNVGCFTWTASNLTAATCGDGFHRVVLFFSANTQCPMTTGGILDELVVPITGVPLSAFTLTSDNGFCTQPAALNNASSGNEFGIYDPASISGPLPVTYIALSANPQDDGRVSVAWRVAQEENVDFYDVLRSTDGSTFQKVAKADVNGQPTTGAKDYSSVDDLSDGGADFLYYQIQNTDLDGKQDQSWVVVVANTASGSPKVYPNPTRGQLSIELPPDFQNGHISIMDMNGRAVLDQAADSFGSGVLELDLPTLPSGTYTFQITSQGDNRVSQQMIYKGQFVVQ